MTMPGPALDLVETDPSLPGSADVVIIGGGIIGVSTALFLAERGVEVVLCEKGVLGGEQSSRNWGWVRVMGRDRREIPLAMEALKIWDTLDARVGGETGFRRSGILYISETEQDVANRDAWLAIAKPHGVDSRQLTADETRERMAGAAIRYKGALYTPSDGRAEPQKAVPAIAAGARRAGARIVTGCAVRGIEKSAGRVSAVVTEKGRIETSTVVLAGGAWSRLFCKGLGIRLPQLKVRNTVLRTAPVEGGPDGAGATATYAYRKRIDGGYTIATAGANLHPLVPDTFAFFRDFRAARRAEGEAVQAGLSAQSWRELFEIASVPLDRPGAFERHRILDPRPDPKSVLKAFEEAKKALPKLRTVEPVQIWAGLIDVTPDVVPVISLAQELPGLVIATGFSGHGFGIGPGAGYLVADLVTGNPPIVDPSAFRLSRFADGSPIEIAPPV
ncbi:FAD-binding oxidoreductase [Sinorhizobium meliloti]|uniref:NAD(P)/FAD-dependent oxidoreductase n=1 Tax=Rhizobium meliloti TaxID=382 RepID=UPI0002FBEBCB|nr:FAD-binding oxidoreductase [Sinorhizobium meliloti]MDE4546599.1 FAD-binding oxidoreductase [Sinorhizobium meliloti]MDE4572381.1 FAD-binding oxidoreductase [Sinorhizobium meliloti]MDX0286544.1 FAD-dependent oxidoreductase [Sinorhizobium meliloti]RVI35932.1 FAD-binding oxidoreductase [Sinorhizobium meliloti]RVM46262.1 FAD-binding oxidoreductase [Sinorhizobium meliloti]